MWCYSVFITLISFNFVSESNLCYLLVEVLKTYHVWNILKAFNLFFTKLRICERNKMFKIKESTVRRDKGNDFTIMFALEQTCKENIVIDIIFCPFIPFPCLFLSIVIREQRKITSIYKKKTGMAYIIIVDFRIINLFSC